MKLAFFIFLISLTNYAATENQVKECHAKIQISNAIEKLNVPNCGFAQGLAKNLEVQDYHRNKIYDKLSEKLALQIEQSLEENALLAQYYTSNNQELLPSGDSKVKKHCRLDIAGEIETCHGKNTQNDPSFKFRLNLLKSKLKNNMTAGCSKKVLSLQEILGTKVRHIIGAQEKDNSQCGVEKNSCPIQGASGAFTLAAQLDDVSSKEFIDLIQNTNTLPARIENFFNAYPQFKLIKNAKGNLKYNFINYLKGFKSNQGTAKEYINQFIFNIPGNQKQLTDTLATQCEDLNNNMETFLCGKDLEGSQLASLDSTASINLFGLNPNLLDADIFDDAPGDRENFYAAYGFQCLAKTQKEKGIKLNRENSIDAWFNNFTKNTRPQSISNDDVEASNNKFCSIYKCEGENVKSSIACKNGGPITSDGLKKIFDCEHKFCRTDILKYISYMEGLKNIENIQSGIASNADASNNLSSVSSLESKPRYSAFLENYLGVNGTLLAEGKKITPLAIAEKSNEFKERQLDPTPSAREAKNDTKPSMLTSLLPANYGKSILGEQVVDNSIKVTAPTRFDQTASNDDYFQYPKKTKTSRNAPTVDKESNNGLPSANYERDAEIKRLRADLESVTKSIKGSESEKLAAVTDNNARFSPNTMGGTNKIDSFKGLNNSEKERVDQYQKNLNSWDSHLNKWQNDIADRDSRSPTNNSETNNARRVESEISVRSSKSDAQLQLTAADKEKGKLAKSGASVSTSGGIDSPEAIVSSDDLANLKLESLKKLGINSKSDFIIKIRYQQKYYNVSVKTFSYKGKDVLVPL
ncbi:MAG: hypothetical protein H7336_15060, partial [Bacteriovorax sp.]|nr:hypothetical protein [Bacteriovorax sp.]